MLAMIPRLAAAGECPSPSSEIATDRPDVTNSSKVVPVGSLQGENGVNSTGNGIDKTFDGTNSRLRLGLASCCEILVDLPTYVGRLQGTPDSGLTNVVPAIKYQLNSLPESWNLSVTAGAGLPTGATAITGPGVQPYLQFPWSHELGNGWGTSGMLTTFFFPSDPLNHETTEATFSVEKKLSGRVSVFAEYVGDFPSRGSNVELFNVGGEYLLTRTRQIDFHLAFGLNRNSPDYIIGVGYSWRLDNLFAKR
jgi:hypothetical protein